MSLHWNQAKTDLEGYGSWRVVCLGGLRETILDDLAEATPKFFGEEDGIFSKAIAEVEGA